MIRRLDATKLDAACLKADAIADDVSPAAAVEALKKAGWTDEKIARMGAMQRQNRQGADEEKADANHLASFGKGHQIGITNSLLDVKRSDADQFSIAQKRAANEHVFRATRFMNKIEGTGSQFTASLPFPEVSKAATASQRDDVLRASNKMDLSQFDKHITKR